MARTPEITASHQEQRPRSNGHGREFHLLRYFSITSGIALLLLTAVLGSTYFLREVNDLVESTGAQNVTLARTFANTIWPRYSSYLSRDTIGTTGTANDPRAAELHQALQLMSRGLPVTKIKIYNLEGRTVYSTDPRQIGENKNSNPSFRMARNGKTVSVLTRRGAVSESDGDVEDADVVSTYVPVASEGSRVGAVFELYSEVTGALSKVEFSALRMLAGLAVSFASLYGILLLIVGRADRLIHRQYREIKTNEEQIYAKNLELQTEIGVRQSVEAALRESENAAAKASQAKTEFLSGISHELRTPMNAILGFAQLLQSEPSAPLGPQQRSFVDQILKAGRHLLELINEVLDLASIEAGKIRLSVEPVSVAAIVDECLPLIQAMAAKKNVAITSPSAENAVRVLADYMRLKQSLLNLMSNAIKYNRVGGTVSISVGAGSDHRIRISVADTGPGIPESLHGDLFRPFHRLGIEPSEVEGTGIGLALTQSLVHAMGGKIGFDSVCGSGTTFWIELPAAPESGAAAARGLPLGSEALAQEPGDGAQRLLYVEDNPANVQLMEQIARRMSLRFLSAHNAELGISLAASEKPDLIVMDINLPQMNGYEALAHLKQDPATASIPVMALSANAMEKDVKRGLAAGFVRYETKPYQVEDMNRAIRQALDCRQ